MAGGRIEEAIAAYRDAINIREDFAEAHANLGVALGMRRRIEESIEAFGQAIALRSDFPEAHDGLGIVLRAGRSGRGGGCVTSPGDSAAPGFRGGSFQSGPGVAGLGPD